MTPLSNFLAARGVDPFIAGFIGGIVFCGLRRGLRGRRSGSGAPTTTSSLDFQAAELKLAEFKLEPAASAAIITALEQGNKIEAIKIVRESTGLGLKRAKELVEAIDKSRQRNS